MIKFLRIFWIPIIILFSCKSSEDDLYFNNTVRFYDNDFTQVSYLEGEILFESGNDLYRPTTLIALEDYLIISELMSDKAFHVVKIPDDEWIGTYGSKGYGPGEIIVPWKFYKSGSFEFGIFDIEQRKIVGYHIDSVFLKNTFSSEVKLGEKINSGGVIKHSNELFYTDLNVEERLLKSDVSGNNIKTYGKIPDLREKYSSKEYSGLNEIASASKFVNHENIFGFAYYNLPFLEIFNKDQNEWVSFLGPDNIPDEENLDKTLYYGSIVITSEYVYGLYYGRNNSYQEPSNLIYVFSHSGELVKKINLDKRIFEFTVYKDKTIYGIGREIENKDYALVRFSLQ